MNKLTTYANQNVLEFYKILPFNYHGTVEKEVQALLAKNAIKDLPAIDQNLKEEMTVLDVGCGAGWFANSAAQYYKCKVTGIDFNPVALERGREVSQLLNLKNQFMEHDLFLYQPREKYDFVNSIGVLHHTDNCHEAIRHICRNLVKEDGLVHIGLYHTYGRKYFLKHFEDMKKSGASQDEMFAKFKQLKSSLIDDVHLKSWFRDQVIHPHETQHTLKEMVELLEEEDMRIITTSINHYKKIKNDQKLFELEQTFESIGEAHFKENKYFSGFFYFLAHKNGHKRKRSIFSFLKGGE